MDRLHSLLKRQLTQHFGSLGAIPMEWKPVIAAINDAYLEFDAEHRTLKRALELSSNELFQAKSDMRALFEALPDLFFRIGPDDKILDHKVGSETQSYLPPEPINGKKIQDINPGQVGDMLADAVFRVRESQIKTTLEYSLGTGANQRFYEARLLPLLEKQVVIIVRNITARKRAEQSVRSSEERLMRHNNARIEVLVKLARSESSGRQYLEEAFNHIIEASAEALDVPRASVWLFNPERTKLQCVDLYESSARRHSRGVDLDVSEFPAYFEVLDKNRAIAAYDAHEDARTRDLSKTYFQPIGVGAVLTAAIRAGNETVGVISHEYVGGSRQWALEEQNFAGSMADLVALALETYQRRKAETALIESQEKFRILAETTDSAIFVFREKLLYVNPAMERLSGYSEAELLERDIEDIVHPDSIDQVRSMVALRLREASEPVRYEIRILTKEGQERWLFISSGLIHFEGDAAGLATAFDITDRKAVEEHLRSEAFHDTLTGLPNRALFIDRLGHVMSLATRRENYKFAVLFLDIDRFKLLNDTLGHVIGDEILVEVASRLLRCLRPGDTVARVGGDEFTMLLEDISDVDEAIRVCERIQDRISQTIMLHDQEVSLTVSIGIAMSDSYYSRPDQIMRDADVAMYRAKVGGRADYKVFDSAMRAGAARLLTLEGDLRSALERNELRLHYQPIVTLETGVIRGFEALVRWQHPQRGLLPPMEFIPLAEQTGLIVPLGMWVLREACSRLHSWQQEFPMDPPLTMSINISSKQFMQPGVMDQIGRITEEIGVDRSNIIIELTENTLMDNPEHVTALLRQLKMLNMQLHVDNFGTGFSSLRHLHRFPIDNLKIDRSFVTNIGPHGENVELAQTIVTLAHNLNIGVTAEGVETEEQARLLRDIHCDRAQGYFFSKPVTADGGTRIISGQPYLH